MALTLHLGAHKTASTHLQLSLRMAHGALRRGGVFYADPAVLRHEGLPLARVLWQDPGEDDARIARQLATARDTFPEMLLSEENILGGTHRNKLFGPRGTIYPGAAARLARVIAIAGGGPAVLCLSVRDPARFNVSAFALQLSFGHEIQIEDWLQGRDPARLNWTGLVRRLAAVPGVTRLLVWRYEDYAALRPQLLARMLPPALAAQVPEPPPSNESMTQAGYEWFLRNAARDAEIDLRVLARRACRRFPRAVGHGSLRLLDAAVYARSAAGYARDIAGLRQLPKVEFLDP